MSLYGHTVENYLAGCDYPYLSSETRYSNVGVNKEE
jgi:hypothetical protein